MRSAPSLTLAGPSASIAPPTAPPTLSLPPVAVASAAAAAEEVESTLTPPTPSPLLRRPRPQENAFFSGDPAINRGPAVIPVPKAGEASILLLLLPPLPRDSPPPRRHENIDVAPPRDAAEAATAVLPPACRRPPRTFRVSSAKRSDGRNGGGSVKASGLLAPVAGDRHGTEEDEVVDPAAADGGKHGQKAGGHRPRPWERGVA